MNPLGYDIDIESRVSDVARDHPGWVCLAALDESASYEIDVTEIWRSPDGLIQLVTASGCSCWSGEYSIEGGGFVSIPALAAFLAKEDTASGYNPSVEGRNQLIEKATERLGAMTIQRTEKAAKRGASEADLAALDRLFGGNPPGWN